MKSGRLTPSVASNSDQVPVSKYSKSGFHAGQIAMPEFDSRLPAEYKAKPPLSRF